MSRDQHLCVTTASSYKTGLDDPIVDNCQTQTIWSAIKRPRLMLAAVGDTYGSDSPSPCLLGRLMQTQTFILFGRRSYTEDMVNPPFPAVVSSFLQSEPTS